MSVKISSKIKAFSVKQPDDANTVVKSDVTQADQERRLVLNPVSTVIDATLRFPKRPTSVNGFTAWTSDFITTPAGKFALSISHYINGITHPFEIFALGHEQPESASLICQMLSKVLSTNDKPFIKHYLSSLKRAKGEAFEVVLPYTGETKSVSSVGAAIAQIIEIHAKHIGYFQDDEVIDDSPMLAAMTSTTEQKSRGKGGLASYDDVYNPETKDDFPLFIKEAYIAEEGRTIPISVWAGTAKVPSESDAILKILSLAMRHRDPKWTGLFLRILRKHVVFGKELGFASVGDRKPRFYGSTWAYVSDLIINRYVQLGILDDEGKSLQQRSLFIVEEPSSKVLLTEPVKAVGLTCPACSSTHTSMGGGCLNCLDCSYSKCN